MLSNTATPKYYAKFRESVINGDILVNEKIRSQMKLIDKLIRDRRYYYDEKAVEGFISFCENELTQTDGTPVKLLDTFKLWAEDLFGWYYYEIRSIPKKKKGKIVYVKKKIKKRLRNKQYLIIARGAAKSMYASFIQAYYLCVDPRTTHQITTAPTIKQSEEVLSPLRTAITRARGPLFSFLTEGSINNTKNGALRKKLSPTKQGIENFITGSLLESRAMSKDKMQGLRPFITTIDEWLSGDIREDVVGAVEQGASKMDDYIIVAISSEGTIRNGPGDTIKMELSKKLRGEYNDPHTSIWWYCLDDIDEVGDPDMWVKAQPNIGLTVTYETYQRDVERAEQNPEARNDILAKRFGIPMEGQTYFFTYDETLPSERIHDYYGMPCALGADLSQGNDFCAFSFLFPIDSDKFGIKVLSFISERTLNLLPLAMRAKYEEFIKEGSLIIHNGTILDMQLVFDDVVDFIEENQYDVRSFGYDPYNAKVFVDKWEMYNGPYCIEKVIQGSRTESVPLGEIKMLAEDGKLIFDQKLLSFCMGNAIVIVDTNGNRKLMKKNNAAKIDNVASTMDAYISYKANPEAFE